MEGFEEALLMWFHVHGTQELRAFWRDFLFEENAAWNLSIELLFFFISEQNGLGSGIKLIGVVLIQGARNMEGKKSSCFKLFHKII